MNAKIMQNDKRLFYSIYCALFAHKRPIFINHPVYMYMYKNILFKKVTFLRLVLNFYDKCHLKTLVRDNNKYNPNPHFIVICIM